MANLLKEAISLPRDAPDLRVIRILHPDYSAAENTLLHLRAVDDDGIDYDTALVACGIITGNTTTGFFATRRPGPGAQGFDRVARPGDSILRGSEYLFQLPDEDVPERPYPVVSRFDDWTFPHDALPSLWRDAGPQSQSQDYRPSCRITDCMWGLERAHIVPLTFRDWWAREEFGRYAQADRFSQDAINSTKNVIPLRSDMHTEFDGKVFAIVPKRDRTPGHDDARGGLSLVVHAVDPKMDMHFQQRFHNRKVLPLGCRIEFLFARFAWTIFSAGLLSPFLDKCVTSRLILVHDRNTGTSTVESRNPEQARGLLAASQSRSASPRKRRAPGAAGDHLSYPGYDPFYSDMEDDSQAETGSTEKSPSRGRSRKRLRVGEDAKRPDTVVEEWAQEEPGVEA